MLQFAGNSPTLIRPQETAGNQLGFLQRSRVSIKDFPTLKVNSLISSDRQTGDKEVLVRLATKGSIKLKYTMSMAGEPNACCEFEFESAAPSKSHTFKVDNYWDCIYLEGISTDSDILSIMISI